MGKAHALGGDLRERGHRGPTTQTLRATHRQLLDVGVPTRRAAGLTGLPKSTQDRLPEQTSTAPQPEPAAIDRTPVNQLTDAEEQHVLAVLNGERFADKPPTQIYATLLAEGTYLCSISTMYPILTKNAQVKDRRRQTSHPPRAVPELQATAPRQVYSWDITKLKGPVRGKYLPLLRHDRHLLPDDRRRARAPHSKPRSWQCI